MKTSRDAGRMEAAQRQDSGGVQGRWSRKLRWDRGRLEEGSRRITEPQNGLSGKRP